MTEEQRSAREKFEDILASNRDLTESVKSLDRSVTNLSKDVKDAVAFQDKLAAAQKWLWRVAALVVGTIILLAVLAYLQHETSNRAAENRETLNIVQCDQAILWLSIIDAADPADIETPEEQARVDALRGTYTETLARLHCTIPDVSGIE